MSYIFGLLLFLAALYLIACLRVYIERRKTNTRGPFPYPYFGLKFHIMWNEWRKKDRIEVMAENFKNYGRTWRNDYSVFTIDPESIKYWTNNVDKYLRKCPVVTPEIKAINLFFGDEGLFNVDGDAWRNQRQFIQPLFYKKSLDGMFPTFLEKSKIVHSIFQEKAKSGEEVDVLEVYSNFTLDSFGVIGFGTELDCLRKHIDFGEHFDSSQRIMDEFLFNPLIDGETQWTKMVEHMKHVDEFLYKLIDASTGESPDLLAQFKSLAMGQPNYRTFIRDVIINLAIAGRDTTSLLLTWTSLILSEKPEILKKIKSEINQVLGDKKYPTLQDLNELKYLYNVLIESLRLFPPVPYIVRFAGEDDVWPDGTHINAGDFVSYLPYFMGRNPEFWKNPEEFNPDRWDNEAKDLKHSYMYLPFHCGPMQCIGRHMAIIQAKTLFCLLLRDFQFEGIPSKPVVPYFGIVLSTQSGAHFRIKSEKK